MLVSESVTYLCKYNTYIPPTDAELTELIMVKVTPSEKEFFEKLTTLLSELDVDGKGTRVIKNNSLSDFVRMSLSVVSNFYLYNICQDSRVMSRLVRRQRTCLSLFGRNT